MRSSDIAGNLEVHVHAQGYEHAQKRPENNLSSHWLLTLSLFGNRKEQGRVINHQAISNTYTEAMAKTGRILGSRYLRKSLSNHQLFTKLRKQSSVLTHDKKYRLQKISLKKKALNRQLQLAQITTNPRKERENLVSRVAKL